MSVDKRIICRFVDPDELVPVGEAHLLLIFDELLETIDSLQKTRKDYLFCVQYPCRTV